MNLHPSGPPSCGQRWLPGRRERLSPRRGLPRPSLPVRTLRLPTYCSQPAAPGPSWEMPLITAKELDIGQVPAAEPSPILRTAPSPKDAVHMSRIAGSATDILRYVAGSPLQAASRAERHSYVCQVAVWAGGGHDMDGPLAGEGKTLIRCRSAGVLLGDGRRIDRRSARWRQPNRGSGRTLARRGQKPG